MFKTLFFLVISILIMSSARSMANDEQLVASNEATCSAVNSTVCAQVHFISEVNTSAEGVFTVRIVTPQNQEIQDLKIDLWMGMHGHGHGSAPVEIAQTSLNEFKVTNAWFLMSGRWLVRLNFKVNGEALRIDVPVEVAE